MIGILIADINELKSIEYDSIEKVGNYELRIKGDKVYLHSGIGIANAAAATQKLIDYGVTELWNYGSVGAYKDHEVYEIVIPEKILYHDVNTPWYKRGQTPGEKEYYINALKGNGTLASGSSFITDKKYMAKVKKELGATIFDMETAAIAQIADKNNIPLKVVKVVSDVIGKEIEELEDINKRIEKAGKIAFKEILKIS